MDKTGIICSRDRAMLREFSRRSLDRLGGRSSLFSLLPLFSSFWNANIRKEIDKDRLIIEAAAGAFQAGRPACELDLEAIFEKTKDVDKVFLNMLPVPSFSVRVRYSDIADIRLRRIGRISRTVYDLMATWPESSSFADAVREAYTGLEFREIVREILRLYSEETRMLSLSLRLLPPLGRALNSFSEPLFEAMNQASEEMTGAYALKLFGEAAVYV